MLGFNVVSSSTLSVGLKNDTGVSASDKLTKDSSLTGLAPPGKVVSVFDNGSLLGTATTSAAGVWTAAPSLADGQHTITAAEVNSQGRR